MLLNPKYIFLISPQKKNKKKNNISPPLIISLWGMTLNTNNTPPQNTTQKSKVTHKIVIQIHISAENATMVGKEAVAYLCNTPDTQSPP